MSVDVAGRSRPWPCCTYYPSLPTRMPRATAYRVQVWHVLVCQLRVQRERMEVSQHQGCASLLLIGPAAWHGAMAESSLVLWVGAKGSAAQALLGAAVSSEEALAEEAEREGLVLERLVSGSGFKNAHMVKRAAFL